MRQIFEQGDRVLVTPRNGKPAYEATIVRVLDKDGKGELLSFELDDGRFKSGYDGKTVNVRVLTPA
jgi:hypothetical protein